MNNFDKLNMNTFKQERFQLLFCSNFWPAAFTGEKDFEQYVQQFAATAKLSRWQTATTENRPYYFATRFKGNA